MAWFDRLKQGLKRTRAGLAAPLGQILRGGKLEPETMEELEEALIAADVGARVATELVESLAAAGGAPLDALKQGIKARLAGAERRLALRTDGSPTVIFVAGVNGSGKTTTVRILLGLLSPHAGTVRVLGLPPGHRDARRRTGYMPQETALFEELTVHENLLFFARAYGMSRTEFEAAEERVLGVVNLRDRRECLVGELSGGQRHRISLAAAMVHSPELLVLDEPTVGVDPPLRASFWSNFRRMKESGTTILMTTHYMDEASNCDLIALIRGGRVIAEGRPGEILERTGAGDLEEAFLRLVEGGMEVIR